MSADDHEEMEADYYARKSSGSLLGCAVLAAALVLALIAGVGVAAVKIVSDFIF
jgi:hypothetical protein